MQTLDAFHDMPRDRAQTLSTEQGMMCCSITGCQLSITQPDLRWVGRQAGQSSAATSPANPHTLECQGRLKGRGGANPVPA